MSRAAARLALALATIAATLPSLPAAATGARAADKRAAATHFQRGRELYDVGQYDDALVEFQAGYDAYPAPGFLVNIGQCQRKLDQLDDAARSFRQFLGSAGGAPRLRAEVEEALAEIDAAQAHRRAAAPTSPPDDDAATPPAAAPALALPAPAAPAAALTVAAVPPPPPRPARKRRWLWALVGSLAASAVVTTVAVAAVELQPPSLRPGSLGLLDGRR